MSTDVSLLREIELHQGKWRGKEFPILVQSSTARARKESRFWFSAKRW